LLPIRFDVFTIDFVHLKPRPHRFWKPVRSAEILTPTDGLDEGEHITMLVMPVMLNS